MHLHIDMSDNTHTHTHTQAYLVDVNGPLAHKVVRTALQRTQLLHTHTHT
jgi:hypothetical protein